MPTTTTTDAPHKINAVIIGAAVAGGVVLLASAAIGAGFYFSNTSPSPIEGNFDENDVEVAHVEREVVANMGEYNYT